MLSTQQLQNLLAILNRKRTDCSRFIPFGKAVQGSDETLDQFHTRLRTLAESCEFHDLEFEIQVQIVIGGRSIRLRKQALRDPKYTLKDMLLQGRRAETSTKQAADIEGQLSNQAVNTVRKHSTPQSSWNTNFPLERVVSSAAVRFHTRDTHALQNNRLAGSVEPLDTLQNVVKGNSLHGFAQNRKKKQYEA